MCKPEDLKTAFMNAWQKCQPDNRPDESFRAMLIAMMFFIEYMETKCVNAVAETVN